MNSKKEMWSSAAKDGLIYSAVMIVVFLLLHTLQIDTSYPRVSGLVNFMAIGGCVYFFAQRRSLQFPGTGFSFAQSMGYLLAVALLAGFVFGVFQHLMWNYVEVDYFTSVLDKAIEQVKALEQDPEITENAIKLTRDLITNPFVMVFASIFNVLIYSCFVGIIVSVMVKKYPQEHEQ